MFSIDYDIKTVCDQCGFLHKVQGSDPLDSYNIMIYQYEILAEVQKRNKHPVNFVSRLFEILSSTHKDVYRQDCQNPSAINGAMCRGFKRDDVYVLKNKPRVFSFNFAWNNTGVERTNALDII